GGRRRRREAPDAAARPLSGLVLRAPPPRHYLDAGTELVIAFTGIPDGLHHAFWAFHDPGSPVQEPGRQRRSARSSSDGTPRSTAPSAGCPPRATSARR